MITAPQLYALGNGDARASIARITRWTQFLGVMGFIMLTLEIVAAVAVLPFVEGLPKVLLVLILASGMTGAVPSYFMITTARAFRSVPDRATLAHFAAPFSELRRLLQWILAVTLINLAFTATIVIVMAADPSLATLMTGAG
ncbi:MAG: hypothetical protein ACYC7A_14130 [Thermoanaerobaculia bacterium]